MEGGLGARRQHEWNRRRPGCFRGGGDTLDGQHMIVDRVVLVTCKILDGSSRQACLDRKSDRLGDGLRLVAKAIAEVGGNGQTARLYDRAAMLHIFIAAGFSVKISERKREAGAGCG